MRFHEHLFSSGPGDTLINMVNQDRILQAGAQSSSPTTTSLSVNSSNGISNSQVIYSSIHSLLALAQSSPPQFKLILQKLSQCPVPTEGEICLLTHLLPIIAKLGTSKVPDLLSRYLPFVRSGRFEISKRVACVRLASGLAAISASDQSNSAEAGGNTLFESEGVKATLDAVEELLDQVSDLAIKAQVYESIAALLVVGEESFPAAGARSGSAPNVAGKHPLLQHLLKSANSDLESLNPSKRTHALAIYKHFHAWFTSAEQSMYLHRLLADSDPLVPRFNT